MVDDEGREESGLADLGNLPSRGSSSRVKSSYPNQGIHQTRLDSTHVSPNSRQH